MGNRPVRDGRRGPAGTRFAVLENGSLPKSSFDDDLVRLKGLIEQGATRAPGKGEVARPDVKPAGAR
jgi:hypothetical protein